MVRHTNAKIIYPENKLQKKVGRGGLPQHIIDNGVEKTKAESVLETLADALIALEYYLSEIELHDVAPPNVLGVAEQSLESLGFPVAK